MIESNSDNTIYDILLIQTVYSSLFWKYVCSVIYWEFKPQASVLCVTQYCYTCVQCYVKPVLNTYLLLYINIKLQNYVNGITVINIVELYIIIYNVYMNTWFWLEENHCEIWPILYMYPV